MKGVTNGYFLEYFLVKSMCEQVGSFVFHLRILPHADDMLGAQWLEDLADKSGATGWHEHQFQTRAVSSLDDGFEMLLWNQLTSFSVILQKQEEIALVLGVEEVDAHCVAFIFYAVAADVQTLGVASQHVDQVHLGGYWR